LAMRIAHTAAVTGSRRAAQARYPSTATVAERSAAAPARKGWIHFCNPARLSAAVMSATVTLPVRHVPSSGEPFGVGVFAFPFAGALDAGG